MSEAKNKARKVGIELDYTKLAHAQYRALCVEQAIELARMGKQEPAYNKLLMVVAIDGVRETLTFMKDDAVIEDAAEAAISGQAN